jgi:hypothetical protein
MPVCSRKPRGVRAIGCVVEVGPARTVSPWQTPPQCVRPVSGIPIGVRRWRTAQFTRAAVRGVAGWRAQSRPAPKGLNRPRVMVEKRPRARCSHMDSDAARSPGPF